MGLLLKNCAIVDATRPEARQNSCVLIENSLIRQTGRGKPPSADQVIDLDGAYLLPGLWDVHTHLNRGTWGMEYQHELALSTVPSTLSHGFNALGALERGVTSLRVVGIRDWIDVAWRDAINAGRFAGPRLFCCGNALNTTAGHMANGDNAFDGPHELVRAVRNEIKHGVDQIKLVTTGGIMGAGHDVMENITFLREEVEAALAIARQRGVPVAVHATSPTAVKWAVNAGCQSLEHGYILDEEAVALMKKRGTYYVPTLSISHLTPEQATTPWIKSYCERHPLPDEFRARANYFQQTHEASLAMALEAGVRIASGSDQGPPGEASLLEVELLAQCGLGNYGAITAATSISAQVCHVRDKLGTIEAGKLADLIVVEADPLEDIHNLRRLLMVIKDGRIVVDKR